MNRDKNNMSYDDWRAQLVAWDTSIVGLDNWVDILDRLDDETLEWLENEEDSTQYDFFTYCWLHGYNKSHYKTWRSDWDSRTFFLGVAITSTVLVVILGIVIAWLLI